MAIQFAMLLFFLSLTSVGVSSRELVEGDAPTLYL